MRNRKTVAVTVALCLALAACSGGGDDAAAVESVDIGTLTLSGEASAGLATYEAKCRACHGSDLTGGASPALGPGSAAAGKPVSELRGTIIGGATGMPAWGGLLDDTEIDQLIVFLETVQGR